MVLGIRCIDGLFPIVFGAKVGVRGIVGCGQTTLSYQLFKHSPAQIAVYAGKIGKETDTEERRRKRTEVT